MLTMRPSGPGRLVGSPQLQDRQFHCTDSCNQQTWLTTSASERVLTYKRNNAGPRMEPWDTSAVIGKGSDVASSAVTRWRRSVR